MKPISLKVDDRLYALIHAEAETTGRSISQVARDALGVGLTTDAMPSGNDADDFADVLKILARLQGIAVYLLAQSTGKIDTMGAHNALRDVCQKIDRNAGLVSQLIGEIQAEGGNE